MAADRTYVPPAFAPVDRAEMFSAVERHPFGTLVTSGTGAGPRPTHLPFLLDRDGGTSGMLLGHLARANPHWREFDSGQPVLVVFDGPHGYVSPTWYAEEPNVPTWNYVAVHIWGVPRVRSDEAFVLGLLERTVDTFEAGARPRWRLDTSSSYVRGLARGVVAFEIPIERMEANVKLSQNRDLALQHRVVQGLRERARAGDAELAAEMVRARAAREGG